ncbi:MAG: TatD family hydrolase [Treponema sp.]|nr:TatD family hydrolase [Treponema sp.]
MKIFDSHLHLTQCRDNFDFSSQIGYYGSTCAFSRDEFNLQKSLASKIESNNPHIHFFNLFAVHPQNPDYKELSTLEDLLKTEKIDAVGECGFDFFTDEFKKLKNEQEVCWGRQLELAASFNMPLVIHGRKCTDMFFRDYKKLKKLPAVMFHSWAGTLNEARSLLDRGVNAFFSFGKPLINGKKSAIECVKSLPLERIFLETDAPYQTLKGEEFTIPLQIIDVYNKACELRGVAIDELSETLYESMRGFYRVRL